MRGPKHITSIASIVAVVAIGALLSTVLVVFLLTRTQLQP